MEWWQTPEECTHLIQLATPSMIKSTVVDNETGKSKDSRFVLFASSYSLKPSFVHVNTLFSYMIYGLNSHVTIFNSEFLICGLLNLHLTSSLILDCLIHGWSLTPDIFNFGNAEYVQAQGHFWIEDKTKSLKGLSSALLTSPLFQWVSRRFKQGKDFLRHSRVCPQQLFVGLVVWMNVEHIPQWPKFYMQLF